MRRVVLASALVAAIVGLSSKPASAQPTPEQQKVMRSVFQTIMSSPGVLAANPGVQKELKMDDDQVKAVKEKVPQVGFGRGFGKGKNDPEAQERMQKMFEKMQKLQDVPEDKLPAKIHEEFKDEIETPTKEVEKILKPEQMTRLKQIARQQGGPGAYLLPENEKDLKLTGEQKSKLKTINDDLQKDLMELRQSGGGGFNVSPETRQKMTALTKEATEKAADVLTSEQKTKWKELTGEPYQVQFGGRPPKRDD